LGYRECAKALSTTAPEPMAPALLHGDYRLGNMLCEAGEIRGIIDWEIWTVSDPRVDLSWFFFFLDEAKHPVVTHGQSSRMPTGAELLRVYEEVRGVRVSDLEWFHALTRYKEAAAMALIAKHARKRAEQEGSEMSFDGGGIVSGLIADAHARVA
jgi:aminoglycoside phosphotransferase (APT) family kinase protein